MVRREDAVVAMPVFSRRRHEIRQINVDVVRTGAGAIRAT